MPGKILAFSGLDGGGKSTQIAFLEKELRRRGEEPQRYWSRGGYTGIFNAFKGVLRKVFGGGAVPSGPGAARDRAMSRKWVSRIWLVLAILDLILLYGVWFRILRWQGKTVLADRYLWDTWIDFRINFPQFRVDRMLAWRFLVKMAPTPDRTFLLSLPVGEAARRCGEKEDPFFSGAEVMEVRDRYYQDLAGKHGWSIIDAARPERIVFRSIVQQVFGEAECG